MSKVLVIEDEVDIGLAICFLLENEGYTAVLAEHGVAAIERLKTEPLPDLIVLDLRMPVMNGWEFMERVRQHPDWSRIPVVITTAESGRSIPGLPTLNKPFEVEDLIQVVAGVVERPACLAAAG